MVSESFSLSSVLTQHADGVLAYAAMDARAAVIGHALHDQAARLEACERDSGRIESCAGLLREKQWERKLQQQGLDLLESALQWAMEAESRKQIAALCEKRSRLHPNDPGREVLDAQMAELAWIGQRAGQHKYSPDQPRVPAGSADGGQWTSGGGGGGGSGEDGEDEDTSYQGEPDEPLDSVYPIETILAFLPSGGIFSAWRSFAETMTSLFGRGAAIESTAAKWTLGSYKSPKRWANQLADRKWTPEEITQAIKTGKKFPAPNSVNKGNTATRYQTSVYGRYIIRDDVTNEIIQIGKEGFDPPIF